MIPPITLENWLVKIKQFCNSDNSKASSNSPPHNDEDDEVKDNDNDGNEVEDELQYEPRNRNDQDPWNHDDDLIDDKSLYDESKYTAIF